MRIPELGLGIAALVACSILDASWKLVLAASMVVFVGLLP